MLKEAFTAAAARAQGMSANRFIDAIMAERSDLAGQMTYTPHQGRCAWTVFIGDEVFKTARPHIQWAGFDQGDLILGIDRERQLLEHLKGKGLPAPEVTYTGKNLLFFGMTRTPGHMLSLEAVSKQGEATEALAKDIAAFCVDLSKAVSVGAAKKLDMGKAPLRLAFQPEQFRADLADPDLRAALGPHYDFFKEAVEQYIRHHQQKYPGGEKTFMHSDLNTGNILIDAETKRLSGIIDFGSAHLTWPEQGLSKVSEFPEPFARAVLAEYSRLQPVQVTLEEVRLWVSVQFVHELADTLREAKTTREKNTMIKAAAKYGVSMARCRYQWALNLFPAQRQPAAAPKPS